MERSKCKIVELIEICDKEDYTKIMSTATEDNYELYKQFMIFFIVHICGRIHMNMMGENQQVSDKSNYKYIVPATYEALALLILDEDGICGRRLRC